MRKRPTLHLGDDVGGAGVGAKSCQRDGRLLLHPLAGRQLRGPVPRGGPQLQEAQQQHQAAARRQALAVRVLGRHVGQHGRHLQKTKKGHFVKM